jgi:hypothetical protein
MDNTQFNCAGQRSLLPSGRDGAVETGGPEVRRSVHGLVECADFAGGIPRRAAREQLVGDGAKFVAFLELAVRAVADIHRHGSRRPQARRVSRFCSAKPAETEASSVAIEPGVYTVASRFTCPY